MLCYLDNSATTKPSKEVCAAVAEALEDFYNPSSLYGKAVEVEKKLSLCRDLIRNHLHADRVIFTSGGTEANNLAIQGQLKALCRKGRILYSAGEHPSVRDTCTTMAEMGFTPEMMPLNGDGTLDLERVSSQLRDDVVMVCLMHVNNEVGAVQPVEILGKLIRSQCPEAIYHVDGVQSFLRCPIDLQKAGVSSYSLSGHKIHAVKGIGALALTSGARVMPLFQGGGQERALRPGTENTVGIAALAAAVQAYPGTHRMAEMKRLLYEELKVRIDRIRLNGPEIGTWASAPHILNVSLMPVRAETMLHALEAKEIYVGNGSACSSHKKGLSPVLEAMGIDARAAVSAVRFSLNPFIEERAIRYAAEQCAEAYHLLKGYERR